MKGYGNKTKQLTYQILNDMPMESFILGHCCLKSERGEYGRITIQDATNYKAIVREMKSDKIIKEYKNFDDLIKDGWVVD
jgi:hypothetical protein